MNLLLIEPEEIDDEMEDVLLLRLPRSYPLWRRLLFKRMGSTLARYLSTLINKCRRFNTETQ